MQHIDFPRQIQQVQILLDFRRVNVIQFYRLFCPVADFQQLPQAVGNGHNVNVVEDICGICAVTAQIAGRDAKVM